MRGLAICLFLFACGDDGTASPTDGGSGDAVVDPDAVDPSALTIAPSAYTVPIGRSIMFVAPNATSWTADGGGIDTGIYTAPMTPGIYHVVASDGTRTATATVTVADFTLGVLAGKVGGSGYVDGPAAISRLDRPVGIVSDGAGGFFVADRNSATIRKVAADGTVSTLSGIPYTHAIVDGTSNVANFGGPNGLAFDAAHGMLYVTEPQSDVVRRVTVSTGEVMTFAGDWMMGGTMNGIGTAARFDGPEGIAFDGANTLYVTDSTSCLIRSITITTREVKTLAGVAGNCTGIDTTGGNTPTFDHPHAIHVMSSGLIYVADTTKVRTISAFGVGTIATGFANLSGLWFDGSASLYVSDGGGYAIDAITLSNQMVRTVAQAGFASPGGIVFAGGKAYFSDPYSGAIRSVTPAGAVATVTGNPPNAGFVGGSFTDARLRTPSNLALGDATTLYVTERTSIRALSLTVQQVVNVAGTTSSGHANGTGAAATFYDLRGLVVDPVAGRAYLADTENSAIRVVTVPGGIASSPFSDPAATPQHGYVDGAGTDTRFYDPVDVARVGNTLYVADKWNNAIRAIDLATMTTTTLAGGGTQGAADGFGTDAQFSLPTAIATDGTNLYLGDAYGMTLRKIVIATGEVTTLAGDPAGGIRDGFGTSARFGTIAAIAYDGAGSLYLTDTELLRRIYIPTAMVSTMAGTPWIAGLRLGSVSAAQLGSPAGLAIAGTTIYLASTSDNAILALTQQ